MSLHNPHDHIHRKERKRWEPIVNAGEAWCTEPICLMADRWIQPGTKWDLAHDRSRPGQYHGPSHFRCNRSEGAIYGNKRRKRALSRWAL